MKYNTKQILDANSLENIDADYSSDTDNSIPDLFIADAEYEPINIGRIVIAEDSSFDFRYLVSCLKSAGLQSPITWVEDGDELLNFLEGRESYADRNLEEEISLIILDLKMPKLDGLSSLKLIRDSKDNKMKDIPVIVLTTSIFEDDLNQATDLGILDYIVKPETQKETSMMIEDIKESLNKICK